MPTETPATYPIAVTTAARTPSGGRQFLDFVAVAAGQAMLARYGFQKP